MKNKNLNQEVVWLINEKYGGRMTGGAKKDIERLEKGEPIDYVIGHKRFCGCKIDLRYKPLIPRDETEFLMNEVLGFVSKEPPQAKLLGSPFGEILSRTGARLPAGGNRAYPEKQNPEPRFYALDIFAGSGCCGIAVLKNVANSCCDFVDIDDNCLKQIRLNLKINGIAKNRYRIIKSDVFCSLPTTHYSLILANPPYIGFEQKNKTQKSVLNFEPKKALFAKNNGLYFIEKFLKQAKNYLYPKGVIYLEFGYNQKKDITKLLKKFEYKNFEFKKDQFNKWRFVKICTKK